MQEPLIITETVFANELRIFEVQNFIADGTKLLVMFIIRISVILRKYIIYFLFRINKRASHYQIVSLPESSSSASSELTSHACSNR